MLNVMDLVGERKSALAAALFAAALVGSVFFQGFETVLFSATLILLLLWVALGLWRVSDGALRIAPGAIGLWLTLFWAWVGVSLLWTRVQYVSVFDFWWIGALPIAFWAYTLSPRGGRFATLLYAAAVLVGLGLAIYAICQFFLLGRPPVSTFLNANSHAALLNLISIPLAARFLTAVGSKRMRLGRQAIVLGTASFLLVFAMALVKGRAATGVFVLGLLLIAAVAYRRVPRAALLTLVAIVSAAFLLAAVSTQGQFGARLAQMEAPLQIESMQVRLQIWQATWHMIQDAPWWGIGSGLFSLVYPAYRLPQETSAGFLAHNDYLQLWLELGLPGLALLLVAMAAALWTFVRALRAGKLGAAQCLEATGLFAALAVTAVHSFVDFNLHVLTILILAGFYLARFQELAGAAPDTRKRRLSLPRFVGAPVYRVLLVLCAGFPLLYFVTVALAVQETEKAQALAREGNLDQADRAFRRAYRFYPTADNVLVSHADLYRHILTLVPAERIEERREVFERAHEFLDKAERLNPLRPLGYVVRASLYEQNADLSGAEAPRAIEAAYRRALELNPRFYTARLGYGGYLAASGRREEARALVEEGLREYYVERESIVPYLTFAARLRAETGDRDGASELGRRIEQALFASGWRRIERPEEAKPLSPASKS